MAEAAEIVRLCWWTTVKEPLEALRFEPGEVTEGGEGIAMVTRAAGRGRGSGAEVDWTSRASGPSATA